MRVQTGQCAITDAMGRVRRIHMVGVGGAGMSGIAMLLLNLGFEVSGSDRNESSTVVELREAGGKISIGHAAEQVQGADVVVISSAIPAENPEVVAAKAAQIPVIPRAEMLAEIMRFHYGIAVAGTHGKTTTTSLVATLLEEGGLDPTYAIGGRINQHGDGARLGAGRYLVAEADESDASFLHLQPMISIVTNIDEDHMSTYEGSVEKLHQTFIEFLHHLPFYGRAIVCIDDAGVQEVVPQLLRPVITYGFSEQAMFRAENLQAKHGQMQFELQRPDRKPLSVTLNLSGRHNVLNALAAIVVATELGVEDAVIQRVLASFQGIARRFQDYGYLSAPNGATVRVIDDYGHHPREVAATLEAARERWPQKRLVLVFQPHRYSRTRDLFSEFVDVLSRADQLVLLEVYPAGEMPIPSADGVTLVRTLQPRCTNAPVLIDQADQISATIEVLTELVQGDDVVLVSGAGNVGTIAPKLAEVWKHPDLG